jgi:hypothetical protein
LGEVKETAGVGNLDKAFAGLPEALDSVDSSAIGNADYTMSQRAIQNFFVEKHKPFPVLGETEIEPGKSPPE